MSIFLTSTGAFLSDIFSQVFQVTILVRICYCYLMQPCSSFAWIIPCTLELEREKKSPYITVWHGEDDLVVPVEVGQVNGPLSTRMLASTPVFCFSVFFFFALS